MVHGKEIYAGFHNEYSFLQKNEIRQGLEHGLSREEIEKYADPAYNFQQMKEIRTAMEARLKPEEYGVLCDPSLSPEQMQEMKWKLARGQVVRKKNRTFSLLAGLIALLIGMTGIGLLVFLPKERPELVLSSDEITLYEGERFEPMYYIARCSGEDGTLLLPEAVDTSQIGKKAAVYRLETDKTEIVRILYVNVREKRTS